MVRPKMAGRAALTARLSRGFGLLLSIAHAVEPLARTAYSPDIRAWPCLSRTSRCALSEATLTSDERSRDVRPRLGSCRQGGHDGYRHREVVQPDEGLRVHSAPGRRQRCVRPYFRGRARRLDHSQRGSNGRIRSGQQPRQGVGGESQNALTAASTARIAAPATRLETFCRYSFATTTSIKLSGCSRRRCNARAFFVR